MSVQNLKPQIKYVASYRLIINTILLYIILCFAEDIEDDMNGK